MATLNISLPDLMRKWVDAQVKGGEYSNASDYIRDLIRTDQRRRDDLKRAVLEGLHSGRSSRKVRDIVQDTKSRLMNG